MFWSAGASSRFSSPGQRLSAFASPKQTKSRPLESATCEMQISYVLSFDIHTKCPGVYPHSSLSRRFQPSGISRFRPGGRRRLRRSGLGGSPRSGFAVERELLSLVVLDSAEKGVVVCAAVGCDLPLQKVDMARSRHSVTLCKILRSKRGVVALDGGAGWRRRGRTRGQMEGHVRLDFERGTKFSG